MSHQISLYPFMKIHFISTLGFFASGVAINLGEKTSAKTPDKKARLNSSQLTKKSNPNLKIKKKTAEDAKLRTKDLFLALMGGYGLPGC